MVLWPPFLVEKVPVFQTGLTLEEDVPLVVTSCRQHGWSKGHTCTCLDKYNFKNKSKQVRHPIVPMSWVYSGNAMSISVEIRMSEDWHPAVDQKNTHDPSMESNHWNQPVMLIIYFKL